VGGLVVSRFPRGASGQPSVRLRSTATGELCGRSSGARSNDAFRETITLQSGRLVWPSGTNRAGPTSRDSIRCLEVGDRLDARILYSASRGSWSRGAYTTADQQTCGNEGCERQGPSTGCDPRDIGRERCDVARVTLR
jgi:hypothetical protein